jgi:beta-N-acetylhexosaminidase
MMDRKRLSGLLTAALVWGALLAAFGVACYLKHPLLYAWRRAETPLLLLIALGAGWLAWRAWRSRPGWAGRLEPGLRLFACLLLVSLVIGQEGRFRWQKYQVEQAGAAMRIIGKHFVVGFRDFAELYPLAERGLIGGIYLTRRNLAGQDAASLRKHIDDLQALRHRAGLPPLFVMADQEGGEVAHLSPLIEPLPALSSLVAQGMDKLEERAYAYGKRQGRDMAALGINMNLSPVVDLKPAEKSHWLNLRTLIERRAIAGDPAIVARVASAYGAGLQASGILPTVKHFPGLGRVQADTHLARASLTLGAGKQASDWLPFREVTARTGAAMMLAHVCLTDIDPERPASLSRKLIDGVLHKAGGASWDYQGLLITDDLNMLAVYQDGIGRAASQALDAGVDLVLVSYDPDQYYRALHAAASSWRNGGIDSLREVNSATRLERYWQKRASEGAPAAYAALE